LRRHLLWNVWFFRLELSQPLAKIVALAQDRRDFGQRKPDAILRIEASSERVRNADFLIFLKAEAIQEADGVRRLRMKKRKELDHLMLGEEGDAWKLKEMPHVQGSLTKEVPLGFEGHEFTICGDQNARERVGNLSPDMSILQSRDLPVHVCTPVKPTKVRPVADGDETELAEEKRWAHVDRRREVVLRDL
jgi:hypothetical protein